MPATSGRCGGAGSVAGSRDRALAFVEPRVLERDRDARRDRLGQLHVGERVATPGLGLHQLQRAEDPTAPAEGDDDRRTDTQALEDLAYVAVGGGKVDQLVVDLRVVLRRARTHRGRDAGQRVGVVRKPVAQLTGPDQLVGVDVRDLDGGNVRLLVGEDRELAPVAESGNGGLRDPAHDVGDLERPGEHGIRALEELRAFARGSFELEQAVAFDRPGDAVGRQAQQIDVGGRELAQLAAADVEDAEQGLGLQRNAGRAAHVAPEHLADDVDLRQVVEHDGLSSLRDPSGKAPADGHVERDRLVVERGSAALDELSARVVEQQHPHAVALEQRGDATGDLRQQLVERQARERKVADVLQPGEPVRERLLGFEGLRTAQRLRAQARDDLQVLALRVGKDAPLAEDDGE